MYKTFWDFFMLVVIKTLRTFCVLVTFIEHRGAGANILIKYLKRKKIPQVQSINSIGFFSFFNMYTKRIKHIFGVIIVIYRLIKHTGLFYFE